jgi:hypothetical protein
MSPDIVLYVRGGLALFVGVLALHLRLERARRKREATMTPEDRRENEIFKRASRGWAAID